MWRNNLIYKANKEYDVTNKLVTRKQIFFHEDEYIYNTIIYILGLFNTLVWNSLFHTRGGRFFLSRFLSASRLTSWQFYPTHPHTGRRSPADWFLFPTALAPLVPDAAPFSRSRSPPPTAFTPPDAAPRHRHPIAVALRRFSSDPQSSFWVRRHGSTLAIVVPSTSGSCGVHSSASSRVLIRLPPRMAVWRCFISQTHGWISSGLEEGSRSGSSLLHSPNPATILLMCSPRKPPDPLLQLAPNWVEATIRSSMPWHNSRYDWEKIPCLLIWSWLIRSQFNFLGADRSGESLPSIAIRKGPNLSRMRPPSSLNGDLESVPLCRLAASIHLGRHCCVAVAVFRTGGPVNHHPRRGGRILR